MNKKLFKQLCMNYSKDADKELYELWEYNLRCYDEDEMQKAISIIIANDKYFPTLSRVLEVVKDVVKKEDPYEKTTLTFKPKWSLEEVANLEIDEETEKCYNDFQEFIKEFRNDTTNNI